MAIGQAARPIEGAVATLGVDERVAFIRRTYAHLAAAIALFVVGEIAVYKTGVLEGFNVWALSGGFNWLLVLGLFMAAGWIGDKWARSGASRNIQYLGLLVVVGAEVVIFSPLIWIVLDIYPYDGEALLQQASLITLLIFGGLTATVFLTRKDFSFLRGALGILTMAALAIIVGSILFGFDLGIIFAGAMIVLMAGWILYYTSQVLAHYPPTAHVAASLALFSAIATLFWYVIIFLMELQGD